jgi:hypothetical protein
MKSILILALCLAGTSAFAAKKTVKAAKQKTADIICIMTVSNVSVDAKGIQSFEQIAEETFKKTLVVEPADGSDGLTGSLEGFDFELSLEPGNTEITDARVISKSGSSAQAQVNGTFAFMNLTDGSLKQDANINCSLINN